MACIQSDVTNQLVILSVCALLAGCSGGRTSEDGIEPINPIYTFNCLERYDKIEADMSESQVVDILNKPTYVNKLDGHLRGAGWNDVTYAGQRCSLIVGFDKKGIYTKGVTDMTGRNSDFEPRFQNFREDQGY